MIKIFKKLNLLLNRRQKYQLAGLFFMMIIGAFLETFSISLIVPIVTTIMNFSSTQSNMIGALIARVFGTTDQRQFILTALTCLIVLYMSKSMFLLLQHYLVNRFTITSRIKTQKMLLQTYLKRPYEFYLKATSGDIIRVISNDVDFAYIFVSALLNTFIEVIVAASILAILLLIDFQMAVSIAAVLTLEVLVLTKCIKPMLLKHARIYRRHAGRASQWILQAIQGIKEILISSHADYFVRQYSDNASKSLSSKMKSDFMQDLPRNILECVTISAMLLYLIVLILLGKSPSSLIPQLSAFAVAAIRLIPSYNRINTTLNTLSSSEVFLDSTLENMNLINSQTLQAAENDCGAPLSFDRQCELRDIVYAYPNTAVNVLDHADMVIPVDSSVGLVGTSGAGKTTAADILLGLLRAQSGEVLCDGRSIFENYRSWLGFIGYIPQTIFLLDSTIRDNVAFGIDEDKVDEDKVRQALREAHLEEFVNSLPDGIDTNVGERGIRLSGGQRQRIGIARALYRNPSLLVFDEATSSLDNETEAAIMESIQALHGKKTMVIIAHRLSTIEGCDIVYRVENGKILRQR